MTVGGPVFGVFGRARLPPAHAAPLRKASWEDETKEPRRYNRRYEHFYC